MVLEYWVAGSARILVFQKRCAEAADLWEEMLKSGRGPSDEIGLAAAEARGFMAGDLIRAIPLYETWLKRNPSSVLREKAEYQYAGALWMSERYEEAAALYLKAVRAVPGTEAAARCDMQRARCLAHLGKCGKALDVYDLFRAAYRKSAWADDALLRAGVLCTGPLGDAKKGAGYFREVLAAHPDGDRAEAAFLYLATLAWWTGEWEEAGRLHRAFLERYPESPFREEFLTVRLPAIRKKSNGAGGLARRRGGNG